MRLAKTAAILGLSLATLGGVAWSQTPPPNNAPGASGNRGSNRDRGGNRTQFRQRMEERMKGLLGASDDEWKVLEPRIRKVQELSMGSRMGMMMMFSRRGGERPGAPGNNANRPQLPAGVSDLMSKTQDLRTLLDNKDAAPDQIKAKLAALRDARDKSKKELADAQTQLREVITVRQEAVLVMLGMLD